MLDLESRSLERAWSSVGKTVGVTVRIRSGWPAKLSEVNREFRLSIDCHIWYLENLCKLLMVESSWIGKVIDGPVA